MSQPLAAACSVRWLGRLLKRSLAQLETAPGSVDHRNDTFCLRILPAGSNWVSPSYHKPDLCPCRRLRRPARLRLGRLCDHDALMYPTPPPVQRLSVGHLLRPIFARPKGPSGNNLHIWAPADGRLRPISKRKILEIPKVFLRFFALKSTTANHHLTPNCANYFLTGPKKQQKPEAQA